MQKKYNITKNFFTVQGWMITELGLKGNELMAYAVVYGFSQDGNSQYTGSINYLAEWLNCSRNTVIETMKSLCDKNLLKKEQVEINSIIFNKYSALNMGSAISEPPVQKTDKKGSAEIALPVQKTDEGSAISAPNNIFNNMIYIKGDFQKLSEVEKIKFLEEVLIKKFNKPDSYFLNLELPKNTKELALLKIKQSTGFTDATFLDVENLWDIFKKEFFVGETYYSNFTKIYSHFGNWIKFQKIPKKNNPKEDNKNVKIILK